MAKYEHIILKGVPYLMDESLTIYTYESFGPTGKVPIAIGNVDADRNLTLFGDWQSRTAARITEWRDSIVSTERGKIRAQFKPPKQSRVRKATGKPTSS